MDGFRAFLIIRKLTAHQIIVHLLFLGWARRFELPTSASTVRDSNQLSYAHHWRFQTFTLWQWTKWWQLRHSQTRLSTVLWLLILSKWCTSKALISLYPQSLHIGFILLSIKIFLYSTFSPFFQFGWFIPLNMRFRQRVWQDLEQKYWLLFDRFNCNGFLQISFPQIAHFTNLPLRCPKYWHSLEQYIPHPFFNQLGLARNFLPQILQFLYGIMIF